VERQAIVVTTPGQIDEIGDGNGHLVLMQTQMDGAAVGSEGDMDGHRKSLGLESGVVHGAYLHADDKE
jgi:hypothetical protein